VKKSILIFLFVSSTLSTFYYALERTNGSVSKSIIFTMYFLGIKLNLIGPNVRMVFDQYQSNQEICRVLPYYTSDYSDYYYGRPKVYMGKMKPYVSYHSQSVIKEIKGGGRLKDAALFLAMLYMLKYHTVGLQPVNQPPPPPHHQLFRRPGNNYNYFLKSSQSSSSLQIERPSSMPHQDFAGLTKEQKRNLPDPRDGFIDVEGHPKLIIRYGQASFKTPKHGSIHGLPVDGNGRTPKTEQNTLDLRDSLVEMANTEGNIFFDNGGYQKGTERGYDSVNLYDINERVIAVYRKQENGEYLFSTTCKLTPIEEAHLYKSNGNFVTEVVLKDLNYKNNY